MSGMTSARHSTGTPGLGAAWAILTGMGATSITYNVVHAVHGGALNIALALVYGIAPVYGAALLSHVVAVYGGGRLMQGITFVLMLGAMGLSIGATAAVVRPVAGVWMQWLFGVVIDGASLVALRVILDSRRRKGAAVTAVEAAQAEAAQARAEAAEAAGERSRLEAELTARDAELAAANAALEALRSRRVPPRKSRRGPARKSRPEVARASGAGAVRGSGAEVPVTETDGDEFSAEAQAFQIWLGDPAVSGSKLGPMVGVSDSMGRTWVRKWKQAAPLGEPQEPSQRNEQP